MSSWLQAVPLPCLSLILLIWSQIPGFQSQVFQFGPCRVEGVNLQQLREAFRAIQDTVQARDNITSIRLLHQEVLQNVSVIQLRGRIIPPSVGLMGSFPLYPGLTLYRAGLAINQGSVQGAESCYLIHDLLKFYLNTVFKNYHKRRDEFKNQKSFSTLANNFIVIMSKLQPSENELFSISESAHRRFLLFQGAFKRLDIEAALTKAFGEVDILLSWMEKFYKL